MSQASVSRQLPHSYARGSDSFTSYVRGEYVGELLSPYVLPSCEMKRWHHLTFICCTTTLACDWQT